MSTTIHLIVRIAIAGLNAALTAPTPNDGLAVESLVQVTASGENTKPSIVARPGGGVYLTWARTMESQTAVLFARSLDGVHFDEPVQLSTDGMDLDLGAENGPNVAVDTHGRIFVVWTAGSWAASKSATTPAKPTTEDHTGHSKHSGKGSPRRPGTLNVYLVRSDEDGKTFSKPIRVNDDPDGAEHRFPTVATDARGAVYVAWLDKRKSTAQRPNFCSVYVAQSTDGGRSFQRNTDATAGQDNSICHCCRVAIAPHADRGVFVAFRNDLDDLRDMFLVHSKDVTQQFSKPAAMEDTGWYVPT
jgi:hypothetical protein